MSNMNRNEFLKWLGGGALLAVAACGDDGGNNMQMIDAPPASCATTMAAITIADNHAHAPHMVVVSAADIAAGVDKTYSIRGNASHDHMITITAAQFTTMLQSGGMVMIMSTVDAATGHSHVVTVSCA